MCSSDLALERGAWVISDRFTDSSYAYQGAGRQLGSDTVAAMEQLVLAEFRPDLTIVLDLDVDEGLARAASVASADRFEAESSTFFRRVRQAFLDHAAETGAHVVDAAAPLEQVQEEIRLIVERFLHD